ncbi:MAG: hypothetical protein KC422_01410 [Trueperaceae bacterium]|nr:hypothetical protein [Trueperaceae bacterium]
MKRKQLWVSHKEQKYPFSLGVLVEALQGSGLGTDRAIELGRRIEKHFNHQDGKTLKLDKLSDYTVKLLSEESSKDVVQRFKEQTLAFVPIQVKTGSEEKLLSKRQITTSLEKLGLAGIDANRIAAQVEQTLRSSGHESISKRELSQLIAITLEANYGREMRLSYEEQQNLRTELQVVEASGHKFPFSHGLLARSLMTAGLEPAPAYDFSRQLEDSLWHQGLFEIGREQLHSEVKTLLEREMGKAFAQRYELMRGLRNPERPLIILIGGAPGVGKSTLAYELAYRLGIRRVISSDGVRQALRSLISPQLSPVLHLSSFTAWQADILPGEALKAKRKRVIRGYQSQVQQLANALRGMIERNILESNSVIFEGAHLLPGMFAEGFEDAIVLELVLFMNDESKHRDNFSRRDEETGHKRFQDRYLEHFSEIRTLQSYILERAKEEDVATIEVNSIDDMTNQALNLILNAMLSVEPDVIAKEAELAATA